MASDRFGMLAHYWRLVALPYRVAMWGKLGAKWVCPRCGEEIDTEVRTRDLQARGLRLECIYCRFEVVIVVQVHALVIDKGGS